MIRKVKILAILRGVGIVKREVLGISGENRILRMSVVLIVCLIDG